MATATDCCSTRRSKRSRAAFPEFAGKHTVNGHLRQLLRLSDETGEDSGRRKTLLMCTDGTAV